MRLLDCCKTRRDEKGDQQMYKALLVLVLTASFLFGTSSLAAYNLDAIQLEHSVCCEGRDVIPEVGVIARPLNQEQIRLLKKSPQSNGSFSLASINSFHG